MHACRRAIVPRGLAAMSGVGGGGAPNATLTGLLPVVAHSFLESRALRSLTCRSACGILTMNWGSPRGGRYAFIFDGGGGAGDRDSFGWLCPHGDAAAVLARK